MVYLIKRILWVIPTLFGISLVTFLLIQLMPGDPAEIWLRSKGIIFNLDDIAQTRQQMGLDRSIVIQYVVWLRDMLHLRMGVSFQSGLPITKELADHLPATFKLMLVSFLVTLMLSIPLGILAAWHRNKRIDHLARLLSMISTSVPQFWLGLVLLYVFSVRFRVFPLMGNEGALNYVLPCLTISLGMAAVYARMLRVGVLDTMNRHPYKVARARGLKLRWLIGRHAVLPALLPFVTIIGNSFGYFWGSSVIVESIFAWPGAGKLIVDSIFNRDYPMIQAFTLFIAVVVIIVNLVVDITYFIIDPRIREGNQHESK